MTMQTRENILQKLESVTTTESKAWKERVTRKAENPKALEKSRIIAINILGQLRRRGMSQKDLAEQLQVTPQTVNSWVKGNSNFTIETIVRIEEVLGVELIGVSVS